MGHVLSRLGATGASGWMDRSLPTSVMMEDPTPAPAQVARLKGLHHERVPS